MNRTDAASLAFRLMGIWFLFLSLQHAAQVLAWLLLEQDMTVRPYLAGAIAGTGVTFFGGWFLLQRAQELAERYYPAREPQGALGAEAQAPARSPANPPSGWMAAALAVLGLWLAVTALPELVTQIVGANTASLSASYFAQQSVLPHSLRLAFGLILLLGSRGLANWWSRDAGALPPDPPTD